MTTQIRLHFEEALVPPAALLDWLRAEHELRGKVSLEPAGAATGAMGLGDWAGIVVAVTSSGAAGVLARSLHVWLTHRHRDIELSVTGQDGRKLRLDAHRLTAADLDAVLQAAAGLSGTGSHGSTPQPEQDPGR